MMNGSRIAASSPEIVIADGQALLRDGLRLLIERMDRGVKILETDRMTDLLKLIARNHSIELIFFDFALPGANGFAGLAELLSAAPTTPVIVLSASEDRSDIAQAVNLGARGYILKSSSREVLRLGVSLVLAGETYVPANAFVGNGHESSDTSAAAAPLLVGNGNPIERLTPRQLQVLRCVIDGQTNKEIARQLGVNETTVKSHVQGLMRKLGAANRTQAARTGMQLGCQPERRAPQPHGSE